LPIHGASAFLSKCGVRWKRRYSIACWSSITTWATRSLSEEALKQRRVTDYVAADVADLLKQLNGKKLTANGIEKTLDTADAAQFAYEPDWRASSRQ
jgi:membrane-bound serine protease (ClpP class)